MFHPGQRGFLKVNHGRRSATVLAVISDRALIEYTMPKGTTALAFIDARFRTERVSAQEGGLLVIFTRVAMRPCTYRFLLLPWLKAVVTQSKISGGWVGKSCRGKVPSPGKLYLART